VSSVSNGMYFLTLPLVSVVHIIYRKIRHARYLYIKRNVEKVWGARYLSKNTVLLDIRSLLPVRNFPNMINHTQIVRPSQPIEYTFVSY
jgi:hypothetical protein